MKNTLRKVAASAVITAGLLGIGTAANAATYGSPWKQSVGFGRCAVFMHVDYNWWEELWGKRDGVEFQYYAAC